MASQSDSQGKKKLYAFWIHGFQPDHLWVPPPLDCVFAKYQEHEDVVKSVFHNFNSAVSPNRKICHYFVSYNTVDDFDAASEEVYKCISQKLVLSAKSCEKCVEEDNDDAIPHTSGVNIVLIGHSMGGLIAVDVSKKLSDHGIRTLKRTEVKHVNIQALVTLDSPWGGVARSGLSVLSVLLVPLIGIVLLVRTCLIKTGGCSYSFLAGVLSLGLISHTSFVRNTFRAINGFLSPIFSNNSKLESLRKHFAAGMQDTRKYCFELTHRGYPVFRPSKLLFPSDADDDFFQFQYIDVGLHGHFHRLRYHSFPMERALIAHNKDITNVLLDIFGYKWRYPSELTSPSSHSRKRSASVSRFGSGVQGAV